MTREERKMFRDGIMRKFDTINISIEKKKEGLSNMKGMAQEKKTVSRWWKKDEN